MHAKSTRPSATIKSRALGALKLASEARDENVPAMRADFLKRGSVCQILNCRNVIISHDFCRI